VNQCKENNALKYFQYCRLQVTTLLMTLRVCLSLLKSNRAKAWLHRTWRRCSCQQYHSSNASDCVHRRRARCCSRAHRPAMVIVTSLWLVQLRGTVCPQNFDHRTCQWLCFVDYWRTRYSLLFIAT